MSQNKVILLLGTNLGDKKNNLDTAKSFITKEIGEIKKESNILENKAEDFTSSNLFFNQKIEVVTNLNPFEILSTVKKIEYNMGRVYTNPNKNEIHTDRLIDIDILYFNNLMIISNKLKVPHPQVYSRDFVKKLIFF